MHFIKIQFINKGIDFIDLPVIARDNTVESSIPNYFENKELLIICYNVTNLLEVQYSISINWLLILILIQRHQIREIAKIQNSFIIQVAISLLEI